MQRPIRNEDASDAARGAQMLREITVLDWPMIDDGHDLRITIHVDATL